MKRWILALPVLLWVACDKPATVSPDPNAVDDFKIEGLTLDNFPYMDCSTSTSPLRDMVMYELLGIPYSWGMDVVSGSMYSIWFYLPDGMVQGSDEHIAFTNTLHQRLLPSSGSHGAFVNLIDGKSGVIIDSRDISRNERQYAQKQGVEIETKPIAWDALVFIVHPDNPVKSLTQNQIRKIYTGEITNWKQVGGRDHEIHPYSRDPDSGSQEKMETLVMDGLTMKEWPEMMLTSMLSPYITIAADEWGIAYTPYYFCDRMVADLANVKVLAVDGVTPKPETVLNGAAGKKKDAYPFFSNIYAAVRAAEPSGSYPSQIYRWLSTPKGKKIINESGYIAL
jgi:phosphate transport system substrate-binding protein